MKPALPLARILMCPGLEEYSGIGGMGYLGQVGGGERNAYPYKDNVSIDDLARRCNHHQLLSGVFPLITVFHGFCLRSSCVWSLGWLGVVEASSVLLFD